MTVKIRKPELNLREKISELDKPSGVAGEAMLRAETPQEQFNLIGAGRRNILINGDFRFSQRGDYSSAQTVSGGYYYLDRWNMDISGVTTTLQNNSDVDLPNGITVKTAKVTATSSATGYMQIRQKIEVEDWMDNRVYTLSAWVKSNTPYPRLRIESAGPTLGNIDSEQTHSGSGKWEYLTMTFTSGNSIVNFNAGVIDWAGGGTRAITSGDYFEVANVQLELGKFATPFEHRSYGEELALCERFYQKSYDKDAYVTGSTSLSSVGSVDHYGTSDATNVLAQVYFRTQMRDAPTVTTYNPNEALSGSAYPGRAYLVSNSGTASYNTTTNNIGSTGFRTYVPRNGGGWTAHRIIFQWQAVAEL